MVNQGRAFFEAGVTALGADNGLQALRSFEAALEQEPNNAEYQSYVALANAFERGRGKDALDLAREAALRAPQVVAVHLNLARIHLKLGDKAGAMEALREGVTRLPGEKALLGELRKLGVRKPPPFRGLPREHFLNKYVGKLRAALGWR